MIGTLAFVAAVVALLMTGVAGLTLSVSAFVPVPLALVAERVTVLVAAVVAVPEISPLAVLIASPAGSPVALKLVGVLVAVIW